MNDPRRRLVLFLLCAAVLLAAGYGWGMSSAYNRFYGPDATLDRELIHLDFNTRVLYYNNLHQPEECRRELQTQLQRQVAFVGGMLGASSPDTKEDGTRKLRAAERVLAGQSIKETGLADVAGR